MSEHSFIAIGFLVAGAVFVGLTLCFTKEGGHWGPVRGFGDMIELVIPLGVIWVVFFGLGVWLLVQPLLPETLVIRLPVFAAIEFVPFFLIGLAADFLRARRDRED